MTGQRAEVDAFLDAEEKRLTVAIGGADPWRDPMLGNYLGGIKAARDAVAGSPESAQTQYGVSYCGGEEIDGPMTREEAEREIAEVRQHIADDDYDPDYYEPMALVRRDYWPERMSEWREQRTRPAGGEY